MKQQLIKISAAIAFLIIVQFSSVFAQQPKTAKEWFALGNLQNEQKQYSQAVTSFSECVRLDKTAYTCFINRGVAYFNLKKQTEAISDYSEVIRLNPRATDAYINRGVSFAELENYSQAKSDFSKALELEPNNKVAIGNLANLDVILKKNNQPNNDKLTEEIFKIIAPIREADNDLELNQDYQNENKLIPAAVKFIKDAKNAVKQLKEIKANNKNLSSQNLRLITENLELFEQRLGRFKTADFNTRAAKVYYQNNKNFDAVQFAKRAIELEGNLPQKSAAKLLYDEIKAKTDSITFAFWNLSEDFRTQYFVGYILENNYAKWDKMPYFVFRSTKLGEYSNWNYAKKLEAAEKFKENFVVVRNNQTKMFEIFKAIHVENTTINSTIAASPFNRQLNPTQKFKLEYESIKINGDVALIIPPKDFYVDHQIVDIIDTKGLSLVTADKFPDSRGTKLMSSVLEKELLLKNFAEAKQTYLYFDRITSATPNLDIIKSTRRLMLLKLYRSSPDLRDFVETEMTRINYTDADKKFVRGK